MALQPGTRLGPYEILSALGAGGMGEVYRARDTRLGREIAIKTLPDSLAADPDRLARFRREAETLAALNHPHIATIFGLEQIDASTGSGPAVLALAMELVEGPTLAERIARGPIPLDEALPLAKELALALEAAHEKGIIHRDLKPANIKLTADGSIKLLDFGLAKALDPTAQTGALSMSPTISVMATQAGVLLGTAAYMSPEQVRGASVDKRADIWAYGVVLFEMLTGRGMFGGETISDTLAGVLREPIDLDRLPAGTPRAIRRLLTRCLERDPRQRLRDIGEARITIDGHAANPLDEPLAATAPAAARPRWETVVPWALVAILVPALATLIVRGRSPGPPAADISTFDLDLGGLALLRGGNLGGFLALARDGRRVVITAMPRAGAEGPRRASQQLYQRAVDRTEFSAIPGTDDAAIPFISPDGNWVGFESHGQLRKVAFGGGVPVRICDVTTSAAGATWLDDATIVFAMGGRLFVVPDGGGTPQAVTSQRSDGSGYAWPSAIPGRRAVLVTNRTGSAGAGGRFQIHALDLQTGRETMVADGGTYPRVVNGLVLYAQQVVDDRTLNPFSGGLLALPFDTARLAAAGPPVAVLENVRVHNGGAGNFDIAANGTAVFVPGAQLAQPVLSWIQISSSPSSPMSLESIPGARGGLSPRLSRDGRFATYQIGAGGSAQVFVFDLERSSLTRVMFAGPAQRPIFGPGDGAVTFAGFDSQQGLWAAAIDGSAAPQRLTSSAHLQVPGAWSADGTSLVFTEFSGETGDILLLRRGERDSTRLVATAADERDPELSPDNRWMAYSSNESGQYEVYVRPISGPAHFPVSSGGGETPVWSRDGRTLYYVRAPSDLMVVDVKTAGTSFNASAARFVATIPGFVRGNRLALTTRRFDLAQDGRFLTTSDPASEPGTDLLRLKLHFDREIHQRLLPPKP